ncbi:GYDIA family GHMP kinase [Elizabethkingia meningoseptica]|uniref:GYDIA family GHMP kinase n=1 Tax=Elizabethkingia meningoseptica TaxID=238 RepID=UPI00099A1CDC|nr:GYDIA family GHMP kinase [Elizabethkingia meningoseptica]MCL1676732.1 GYDIA family GHMP kinase [Elizabethkingia meningoseptica]MCL1686663.1 GYDIA family GHMP kinase [Elizabethkingia meningoseptica]OPC04481.1 30S ribosomal protein S6 [Elizabethkingia meningoseptica]
MNKQQFFSHGKLLLTSEYFVLDGAKALAIPTRQGQELSVEIIDDRKSCIYWETYRENIPWLKTCIDYKDLEVTETNKEGASAFILKIFRTLKELHADKLEHNTSYILKSNVQFPENYGLGSSSTLMNNLADWAGVDAFLLNDLALGGSGYDIAVAKEGTPVLYTRKENEKIVETVNYKPAFSEQLLFVHLNKKQDSREGIRMYREKDKSPDLINFFSALTDDILKCPDLENFSLLMEEHEKVMSNFLKIPPVKEKYFKNAPSFFKSLGAWGGDFILTTKFRDYESYFLHNGFPNFFSYEKIIY